MAPRCSHRIPWDDVFSLWDSTLTNKEIADRYGVGVYTIRHGARMRKWPTRARRGNSKYDWHAARLLWDQGRPKAEIAAVIGCAVDSLRTMAKCQGWTTRERERGHGWGGSQRTGRDWHEWSIQQLYPGRAYRDLTKLERDIAVAVTRYVCGIPQSASVVHRRKIAA